ncbi:hypothetical protein EDD85DRAFT_949023 [Armillaria nabsnona]|nr:hypothetical protein EDD85DRAFT_949023 [Armillaria nabsnona]
MSDLYYLLHAILKKAPALWDMEAFDLLNNHQIAVQVERVYTLLEVYDNLLLFSQATHPFIEMHDCNFTTADHQIWHLLNTLHEAYKMHSTMLCNLLQAFSSVKGGHDTDAMLKFACKYSTSHHLIINMELIMDEDGLLQKVSDLRSHHYYPCHSKTTPEPLLPMFTIFKDKTKKKQKSSLPVTKVNNGESKEQVDDEQVMVGFFVSQGVGSVSMNEQDYSRGVWPFKVSQQHHLALREAQWSPLSHLAYSLQEDLMLVSDFKPE